MKHTIRYKGTKSGNYEKALADCKFWLGTSFQHVVKAIRKESPKCSIKQLVNALQFAGIEGFPARVLVHHSLRTQ
jgi:hypothetical protein